MSSKIPADLRLPVDADGRDVHTIWSDFNKKFRLDADGCAQWKYTGYDMQLRVERWAKHWNKRYPGEIQIARIDDAVYASSRLVMIEHRNANEYMGISVVVIPQCCDHPMTFFLYPGHRAELLNALKAMAPKRRRPNAGVAPNA